jgi:hypothetical protein
MFSNLLRHVQAFPPGISRLPNRRAFSYVSTNQTFPASLYRFQIHRDSRLFDRAFAQDDWEYEDGIAVSEDGLVHPNITIDCMRMHTSPSSPAKLFSLEWCIIHAEYALYAEDYTRVFGLLPRQRGRWSSPRRTSLSMHPQR